MNDLNAIRIFMENHVFSVWLFMCLLESLIRRLRIHPPNLYLISPNASIMRALHSILIDEETDVIGEDGGVMSHLGMYMVGMEEMGASVSEIQKTMDHIALTGTISEEFVASLAILNNTKDYIISHLHMLSDTTSFQSLYSYFTYGREMIIPNMFQRILDNIGNHSGIFRVYLERHIHLDQTHGDVLQRIYPEKDEDSIRTAYDDRIHLWNGIHQEIITPTCADIKGKENNV